MSDGQLFILKKETAGATLPYLIKLNREASVLEIFKKCHKQRLYDELSVRKTYDASNYMIFEKAESFPCIFGGEKIPTPAGLFYIEGKSTDGYISSYYPGYDQIKFFGYLVIFEDYFIHSDLYGKDASEPIKSEAISRSDSTTSGCVRVSQENLAWLLEHIDVGTPVFL